MNLLIIDFNETATDEMSFGRIIVCYGYDLLEGSRYDTLGFLALIASHHGMCFSTTGLSICEYCAIVAFKDVVDK